MPTSQLAYFIGRPPSLAIVSLIFCLFIRILLESFLRKFIRWSKVVFRIFSSSLCTFSIFCLRVFMLSAGSSCMISPVYLSFTTILSFECVVFVIVIVFHFFGVGFGWFWGFVWVCER